MFNIWGKYIKTYSAVIMASAPFFCSAVRLRLFTIARVSLDKHRVCCGDDRGRRKLLISNSHSTMTFYRLYRELLDYKIMSLLYK